MSDKGRGPGGSEPQETPTEQLLREAMGARASLITAHDLRPAQPPNRRVRRLRPVYVTAVPLFGLAAALAFGVLNFRPDTVADREHRPDPAATLSASPSPTPEATTAPSPTASAAGTPDPDDGESVASPAGTPSGTASSPPVGSGAPVPYTFRNVKFKIPAGWRAAPSLGSATTLCVLSPGAPQVELLKGCAPYGVELTVYNTADEAANASWPRWGSLESDRGWSDRPLCPIWGKEPYTAGASAIKLDGVVRTRDIVAGRAAHKTQWQATCNGKDAFTAQLWGLPDEELYLSANGLKPEYQAGVVAVLDSLDLSGRPAPAAKAGQNTVAVSIETLGMGQQVPANGSVVAFSVVYRNTGQTDYAKVQPLVHTEEYAGTPGGVVPSNAGRLERLDGTVWTQVALSPGSDMGYAAGTPESMFPLAPGQSRTVKYRMTLTSANGAGVMPVTAQAVLPYDGNGELKVLGKRSIPVRVVKP
ncbi:hypothetical protein ACWGB8_13650 [Kitasatospora sp. NPDC054939]